MTVFHHGRHFRGRTRQGNGERQAAIGDECIRLERHEFARFVAIHRDYFPDHYPAWTAVGVTALLAEGAVVEMRVTAVIGAGKSAEVRRANPPKP